VKKMAAVVLTSTENLSRENWLKYRNLGIGGSDAAVVCGASKYKSPLELWQEKTGQKAPDDAGEAAYWGTKLESLVRDEFTLRSGIKVIPAKQILRSKDYPFMLANLDGVCRCPIHGRCIFEAKTASAYKAGEWEGASVPQEYVLQIQHYLCVTGFDGAYIAALIGGNSFQWKFIKRDEELISMLIKYERSFWMHVEDDVPPPPDGSDACAKFLNQRYAKSKSQSEIQLPDSAADLIRKHNDADEQMEKIKIQKQQAANLLKEMLGEHELGIIGDGHVKWMPVKQERFNAKLLEAEQPEIHAKYTMKSSYRRFTIKEPTNLGGIEQLQLLREAG
jgi:putative phage-type endonuclease